MFKRSKLFAIAAAIILAVSAAGGAALAESNADTLFGRIRTVYNLVSSMHKDGADLEKFVDGAIKGGLEALGDPHTNYFPPAEYDGFLGSLNGSFSGIGAYLDLEGSYVVVSAPIKNTPADKAGLQSGDRILEANGTTLVGSTVEKAVQLIRGPAGTAVTLKIERASEARTFTVTITRAVVNIPEVDSKMLEPRVGYIQLTSFGDDSVTGFFQAVGELKAQGATGLVLDLRQNPGGYLDAAVDIAGAFVPKGETVVIEVRKGSRVEHPSSGQLINLPTVVLVDKGSASAAEILAGAIQDYAAGQVVGTQTFGKGTVQQIVGLSAGGGLKVTIAEYLTPKERHVHGIGLTPDVIAEQPKPSVERTRPMEWERSLYLSSVGLDVLNVQHRLEDLGYKPDTSGFFGGRTEAAVLEFARDNKLPVEPFVSKEFIEVLNRHVANFNRSRSTHDGQLEKAVEIIRGQLK